MPRRKTPKPPPTPLRKDGGHHAAEVFRGKYDARLLVQSGNLVPYRLEVSTETVVDAHAEGCRVLVTTSWEPESPAEGRAALEAMAAAWSCTEDTLEVREEDAVSLADRLLDECGDYPLALEYLAAAVPFILPAGSSDRLEERLSQSIELARHGQTLDKGLARIDEALDEIELVLATERALGVNTALEASASALTAARWLMSGYSFGTEYGYDETRKLLGMTAGTAPVKKGGRRG